MRREVSFRHRSLYPKKMSPQYPLNEGLYGPQNRSGSFAKNIHIFFYLYSTAAMQNAGRDLLPEKHQQKDMKFDERLLYQQQFKISIQKYVILLVIHTLFKPNVNRSSVLHKINPLAPEFFFNTSISTPCK
jgi:hypothetical protein